MFNILSDVVFFGPGLYSVLVVAIVVGVILGVFREKIDPLVRRILVAVLVIVFVLWLLSLAFDAPVWVR